MSDNLLEVKELSVEFDTHNGTVRALDKVSVSVRPGEILGLVGETGCGKSVLAKSVLRLLPSPPARVAGGEILFNGENVLKIDKKRLRNIRGGEISMIFQEPMNSLNPVFTVGSQMTEVAMLHRGLNRKEALGHCARQLARVNMPDPERVLDKYPHELSGGMRQRVMIAMELSCDPKLLIADEPTTALDVTVQGQVLSLIAGLAKEKGTSVLLITHDMGVVAQVCDRVAVMYAGRVAEIAPVTELFSRPLHPYTQGLIGAIPCLDDDKPLIGIRGTVPPLSALPPGCRFHARCGYPHERCDVETPPLLQAGPEHFVACTYGAGGAA